MIFGLARMMFNSSSVHGFLVFFLSVKLIVGFVLVV